MTENQINDIMHKSYDAFIFYRKTGRNKRAEFLETIADEIELLGQNLIETASAETNLPHARLIGERGRTTGQLRQFANLIREGSWVEASIDTAIPDRSPAPKPDLRKMNIPLGPVIVFGASNFPLAYSTAGGDTASALAAGCSVVVKGHPAHSKTSEMIAEAIVRSAKNTGMPDNVFQHVSGSSFEIGKWLVQHNLTTAVGFTGSLQGGKALMNYAANRKNPIPVFAEMGSVNPVILLPNAVKEMKSKIAETIAGSITLGMGQFCTNPGLMFCIENDDSKQLLESLSAEIEKAIPAKMLHSGISENYHNKRNSIVNENGVNIISVSKTEAKVDEGFPTLATVSGEEFVRNPKLHEEIFGPFSLVVRFSSENALVDGLKNLEGQLSGTLWATESDLVNSQPLLAILEEKVGRIVINGAPTGVEVCPSIVHGGPFPATTDSRFTSVGTSAIQRFVRPVCYQNFPDSFLPNELQNSNPENIWRLINNEWTKNKVNYK